MRNSILCGLGLLFLLLLLWPMSFGRLFEDGPAVMHLICFEIGPGTDRGLLEYEFSSESEEYQEIMDILSGYRYHRTLRSFTNQTAISGTGGYTLKIYVYPLEDGEEASDWDYWRITGTGTNEVRVGTRHGSHVYRMGYWGKNKTLPMMDEICAVLEIVPSAQE